MNVATVSINGKTWNVKDHELSFSLLKWLREVAGLTGAKCGCGVGQCGSCNVLIDGKVRRSCIYKMEKVIGKEVITVEGLEKDGKLHPVQESFIACGVMQCGYCTPSQIITVVGLLLEKPEPTKEDIDKAFRGVYCRCGTYPRVIKAIQRASAIMQGKPWQDEVLTNDDFIIGRSYPMTDAIEKVTGKTKFVDDYYFEGMLYGKVIFSEISSGVLVDIDVSEAEKAPGVKYVMSYKNARPFYYGPITHDVPVMCDRKIRSIEEPIAAVFAETQEQADAAAKLIKAKYEETEGIFTPERALEPDAPKIHEQGNITSKSIIKKGNVEKAFQEADEIVEGEYYSQRIEHAWIETEAAVVVPKDDGTLDVYHMTQAPFSARDSIARYLNIEPEKVNSIQVTLGGSFGGKGDDMTRIICAGAAIATGRPAKLSLTRKDSLRHHYKRHPYKMNYKVAAKKDGKILGMDIKMLSDGGAYSFHSHRVMGHSVCYCTGPYEVENLSVEGTVVYTNNVSSGAMRGYGVTQTSIGSECIMDELAVALQMDPIELRKKNALRPGMRMPAGQIIKEGHYYLETLEAVQSKIKKELEPLKDKYNNVGIGFASIWRYVGGGIGAEEESYADIEVLSNGDLYLRTSISEMGNETQVAMKQLVAEDLKFPYDRINLSPITTKEVPWGGSVMASRGTFLWGNAVLDSTRKLRGIILEEASALWSQPKDALIFKNGKFFTKDGDLLGDLADMADAATKENRTIIAHGHYQAKKTYFPLEDANINARIPEEEYQTHHTSSYCSLAVAIQVDEENKKVKVLKLVAALDIGKVINPEAALRQIEGGFIMGQGMALSEEFVVEQGINTTDAFVKYKIMDLKETPEMDITMIDAYDPVGPMGAKGVGEISLPAMMPAILNAYYNATGERIRKLPLTKYM